MTLSFQTSRMNDLPNSLPATGDVSPTILPILATATDAREVVQFLKRRPEGLTIVEAMDAVRKRIFDPRKILAYELWGIVLREGNRLKLSPLGWEFAERLEPEAEIYRAILNNILPYHSALEWMDQLRLELVTYTDVGKFWHEHHSEVLGGMSQERLEAQVVSFFHLCQAAEIGMATVGRKGQPSRLRTYLGELRAYVERSSSGFTFEKECADQSTTTEPRVRTVATKTEHLSTNPTEVASAEKHVLISCHKNKVLPPRLGETLELAEIKYEVVRREPGGDVLLPQQILKGLRRSNAGIIVVSEEDCLKDNQGREHINDHVLMEIGAALALFENSVVFLSDTKFSLPLYCEGLHLYQVEEESLPWEMLMELVKTIKHF